jgi:hypothetical protein
MENFPKQTGVPDLSKQSTWPSSGTVEIRSHDLLLTRQAL